MFNIIVYYMCVCCCKFYCCIAIFFQYVITIVIINVLVLLNCIYGRIGNAFLSCLLNYMFERIFEIAFVDCISE